MARGYTVLHQNENASIVLDALRLGYCKALYLIALRISAEDSARAKQEISK
jgi:hypothetical protein